MSHPLIREVQLGKSVEELCRDNFGDYQFQVLDPDDDLPGIVREIVRRNKPDLKFAVKTDDSSCRIILLNDKGDIEEIPDYWDDEYNMARDDDAACDCEYLNQIVLRIFGVEKKKPKAKITKKEYARKKCCPYCLGKDTIILDDVTFKSQEEVGCRTCGETWGSLLKIVVTGFC